MTLTQQDIAREGYEAACDVAKTSPLWSKLDQEQIVVNYGGGRFWVTLMGYLETQEPTGEPYEGFTSTSIEVDEELKTLPGSEWGKRK